MRFRKRYTYINDQVRKVSWRRDVSRHYSWNPECQKAPFTEQVGEPISFVHERSSVTLPAMDVGCSLIYDECQTGRWWDGRIKKWVHYPVYRFGECVHVKQAYLAHDDASLNLVREWDTYDWQIVPYGQCSFDKWALRRTLRKEKLDISCMDTFKNERVRGRSEYLPMSAWAGSRKRFTLQQEALKHFIPDLEDGFSLPIFIAELKDVPKLARDVIRMWKALLRGITAAVALLTGRAKRRAKVSLKKLGSMSGRELSNDWLSVNFGWVPFVRDIKTIVTRIYTLREDIEKYLKSANTWRTLHFQKGLSPYTFRDAAWLSDVVTDTTVSGVYGDFKFMEDITRGVTFRHVRKRSVDFVRYTATMNYRYNVPLAHNVLDTISAAMDRFGMNPSISDIWELIPFSFVVDWVFDVGHWLDQFDLTNLQQTVEVAQFCDSVKFTFRERSLYYPSTVHVQDGLVHPTGTGVDWLVANPSLPLSDYREEVYYRLRGQVHAKPEDNDLWGEIKPFQIITSVALGAQAAIGHRRWTKL